VQVVPRPQLSQQGRGAHEPSATGFTASESQAKARHLKLVDGQWYFQSRHVSKLMTKGTDFIVIGVLGAPGTGKSRLLNDLCGLQEDRPGEPPPFEVDVQGSETGVKHCTTGVDIRVGLDRVIAIDTQPVKSSSVLLELLQADSPAPGLLPALQTMCSCPDGPEQKPVTNVSAEAVAELMDLQLAMWLLRVCHVVVVMSSDVHAPDIWRLLSTAGMLQGRLPDLAVAVESGEVQHPQPQGPDSQVRTAQVVLGATGVDLEGYTKDRFFHASLAAAKALEGSTIHLARNVHVPGWFNVPASGQQLWQQGVRKAGGLGFLLPAPQPSGTLRPGSATSDSLQNPSLEKREALQSLAGLSQELCHQILALQRHPRKPAMSEQEWLAAAGNMWNAIQESEDLGEYIMHLQGTLLHSAGGWRVN